MACHLRSISLPSRPHSKVAEELRSLEACISSPSMSIETISDGLRRLGDIYGTIEEIICLPSNKVCSSEQKKMLDGETECTLVLLDLCRAMLEDFTELKATMQDLQVALGKGDDAAVSAKIQSYTRLLSKQIVTPKWPLVSKAFQKKNPVACKEEQLQMLECNIGDLEVGAGILFRRLLQSRVTLLNILRS